MVATTGIVPPPIGGTQEPSNENPETLLEQPVALVTGVMPPIARSPAFDVPSSTKYAPTLRPIGSSVSSMDVVAPSTSVVAEGTMLFLDEDTVEGSRGAAVREGREMGFFQWDFLGRGAFLGLAVAQGVFPNVADDLEEPGLEAPPFSSAVLLVFGPPLW